MSKTHFSWKHKTQVGKHKNEEKIRKIIYYLNSEKIIKVFFYCYKKVVYENIKNTKNKSIPSSQINFFVFFILKKKKILENRNKKTLDHQKFCSVWDMVNWVGYHETEKKM